MFDNTVFFSDLSSTSSTIISISIILLCGFLATRLTRLLKLPNVTAYILTGIVLGPYVLNLIPMSFVKGTDFLPDLALSFIAFSTGEFFRIETLKKSGISTLIITLCEALLAFALVFLLSFFILKLDLSFCLVIAALATATAPASTMMTIRQTNAKGDFVETLLQVVALDDVVALLSYSIAVAICQAVNNSGSFDLYGIVLPIIMNIVAIIVGAFFAIVLKTFIQEKRSTDNRLIIAIAIIFGYCGLCTIFDVSPLLGCMVMSTVYINLTDDDRLFKQLNYFSPPILLLFFVRSGINFNISALFNNDNTIGTYPLFVVGIIYFATRILGKYYGSYFGSKLAKKSDIISKYLGLALFPQAGVAIGLAALGSRVIGGAAGEALNTVIMTSSILYELVGPVAAKTALQLSGSFSDNLDEIVQIDELTKDGKQKTSLELLIERIHKIQEDLPKHEINEDERAFEEAIEEMEYYYRRRKK